MRRNSLSYRFGTYRFRWFLLRQPFVFLDPSPFRPRKGMRKRPAGIGARRAAGGFGLGRIDPALQGEEKRTVRESASAHVYSPPALCPWAENARVISSEACSRA